MRIALAGALLLAVGGCTLYPPPDGTNYYACTGHDDCSTGFSCQDFSDAGLHCLPFVDDAGGDAGPDGGADGGMDAG